MPTADTQRTYYVDSTPPRFDWWPQTGSRLFPFRSVQLAMKRLARKSGNVGLLFKRGKVFNANV